MTSVLVLNGPNLNLLGTRKPEVYGRTTLADVEAMCREEGGKLGLDVEFRQSNHEGALIDRLHERDFDGVIVNAAGLTHTSVALRDALTGVDRPFWEVHLTDPWAREPFRSVNFIHDVATGSVAGQGWRGYHVALDELVAHLHREGA